MYHKKGYSQFVKWFIAIGLLSLLAFPLLGGVAQAGKYNTVSYTQNLAIAETSPTITPTVYSPLTISGRVIDAVGNPISFVEVYSQPYHGQDSDRTDTQGYYTLTNVQPGTYQVMVQGALYEPQSRTVTVPPSAVNIDFQRIPPTPTPGGPTPTFTPTATPSPTVQPTFSISGRITDKDGNGIPNAEVKTSIASYVTNADGYYSISNLIAGTYALTPTVAGLIFEPTAIQVNLVQDEADVNFQQICISPKTGLNACELEVGDILLWRGNFSIFADGLEKILMNSVLATIRNGVGTYWWHTAIYTGDGILAHAVGDIANVEGQVRENYIADTSWWKGEEASFDWVVIRPKVESSAKQLAANYAHRMAIQDNPPIRYVHLEHLPNLPLVPDISPFYERESDSPTYCSKLVWKSYIQSGTDLERDFGVLGGTIFGDVITPDDLYYSAFEIGGLPSLSDVVWEYPSLTNNRAIFFLLSPADLLLTDSQGRKVGHDPLTGTTYDEIPGALYTGPDTEPESISLLASTNLTWTLGLVGTGDGGQYTIKTAVISGTRVLTDTVTASIAPNEQKTYQFNILAEYQEGLLEEQQPTEDEKQLFLPLINR